MTSEKKIRVRSALPADASSIARIDQASGIVHAPHVPALIDELLALGLSLIAEVDGRPVGYAVVSKRFYSRWFLELLAVAPEARRLGVGAALLEACVTAADGDLFTSTNHSNRPMQALMAKTGFAPSGVILNLDPGNPELFYVRFRDPPA